ncbi:MAG: zinc ribbon domain-containing protein [Planctomycetota bacterium]
MKRCPGCSHEVPENASKCNYCGLALGTWQAQSAQGLSSMGEASGPARRASAGDVPLVMMGTQGAAAPEPQRPSAKALPAPTIRLEEAFRVGLQLIRYALRIMRGRCTLRSLTRRQNHMFENLGKAACRLQFHHRDLSPIYDRLRAIEQQEAEKMAMVHAVGQQALSEDRDIRKAEIALQKVKIRKINQAMATLNRSKGPIFRELGATVNALRIPGEGANEIYLQIDRLAQDISRIEAEVQGARVAIAAVDRRKKWFVYVIWMYVTIIAILIVWALLVEVVKVG